MKTSLVNTNKLHTHFITTKTKLLTLLVIFLASFGWGQVASTTYDFSANATGWTGTITRRTTTTSSMCGSAAMRQNLYPSNPTGSLISPLLSGTNNLGLITLTYKYRASDYSTYAAVNPWGYFNVQVGNSATGPWTTVATVSQETQTGSCITKTHTFSPPSGSLYIKWDCFWTAGDYFIVFDDIAVSQGAAASPCSGSPTAGTIASNTSQNVCSGTTPSALTVTGTTTGVTGITFQWEESSDNATWANATGGSGATAASYTPPAFGGTTIYYRCKVTCSGSSLFDVTNVATIAPPVNPSTQASSLAFSSLSYTGFTASWTNGNGNRRVVYISDAAITDPTNNSGAAALTANTTYSGTGQQIVYDGTGASVSVTGLALGTTYNVKVIEYTRCGSGPYDNYFNVSSGTNSSTVTTSTVSAVPWSEGFASGVASFPNWLTTAGSVGTTTALDPAISSNYYYVNLDGTPSTAAITTPIIGSIPSNYRFVVKYKLANYSSPYASPAAGSGDFIVAISTNNGTSYTDVATVANNTVAGWQEYALNLSAYVGQNIRIRLTGNYSSGDYYLAFDDFSVEAVPSCFPSTALTSSSITNSTASIGWTAPANGTSPAGYQYEVRTSGAAGSGSTGLVASGSTTAPTVSASLTGLSGGTAYTFYVRSNCGGGDYSTWSSASFTTLCDVITAFPYTENFDGVTAPALPNCWSVLDVNADGDKWITYTGYSQSGNNSVGLYTDYNAGANNDFLISPQFNLSGIKRLKYSVRARSSGEPNDYRVLLSTTGTSASDFSTVLLPLTSVSSTTYSQVIIDLSMYSGNVYIAFNVPSGGLDGYYIYIDDVIIEETPLITWTGSASTNWNTAANWSPAAVPASTNNINIPTTGITNFPVVTSLTIAAGSTMSLNANARLTVNGTLTNNGTLTLESGATLVQDGSGTVTGSGTFNVKQALTGAGGATPSGRFWYLGSPVSGATSNVFNAAGNNRLWTYSETALAYNTEITDNTTALSPMQGTVVRLGANETSIFTGGLLNTGDYTSSLTRTGTTDSKRGYTLLSNPYPSYLDWSAAYNAAAAAPNANISSSIWYRSHNSTSNTMVFDIFNASGSVATTNSSGTTTQYIPPMQAFWVYNPTDGTTGSLTFSNSMRSHQPTGGGLKSSTDFPAFVRLNLENDGAIDQTVLYFDNNAAAGYDNFDSDKMMLANAAQVYSFVDSKKLAINGMKSVKANKQVPLTVEFPTAKSYAFNATEVVMTDGIVLLEDRLTKVFQDLTMNPVYEFEAAAGTDADRFVVHFQANGGVAGIETAEDNGIAIVSNATGLVTITLSEELPAMGTIQIIDANGKVIATQAINEQATTMNINAATGIYHVLVDTSSKIARKKIVITK